MSYIAEIDIRVAGIPCIVAVTHFECVKGSFSYHAASDMDYHGYTECEFEVLDRKGRRAPWLERKLTDDIVADIEGEIAEALAQSDDFDY